MSTPQIERCLAVLDREYKMIIEGDWAALSEMEATKIRSFEQLRTVTVDVQQAERLKMPLARNARLLEASQNGIAAAIQRLAQITASMNQSQVYGPSGAVQNICTPTQRKVEKRS